MTTLIIDDQEIQAEEGQTILEVARQNGIEIPTLCHHPLLEPYGACRLCTVEVIRRGRSQLQTACTHPAWDGLEVKTRSPQVIQARKMILGLLLSRCPNVPQIQDLAREYGIEEPPFPTDTPDEKCILCGLCVRVCSDVVKAHVLHFSDRGVDRVVGPPFLEKTRQCIGCGACTIVCPTGAIEVALEEAALFIEKPLGPTSAIYVPLLQGVPRVPVIDTDTCIRFRQTDRAGIEDACGACVKVCGPEAIDFDMEEEVVELDVGTIILATGFSPFDPTRAEKYGYGLNNVLTGLEFERMVNTSGFTGGKILLEDGRAPESVAIVHCVGSRDEDYNIYCSRVCCMYSMKLAHLVRENTDAKVYEIYRDVRAFGKGYEEFYNTVEEEGVTFIHGEVSGVVPENGQLVINCEDTFAGQPNRIAVDAVVLAVGMEPRTDAGDVATQFGISRSEDGFFLEKHPKLAPVDTASDGIFVAGACQGPKDIPDTVAQAGAAAAAALAMMDWGKVAIEPFIPQVFDLRCVGCGLCVEICPYQAIELAEGRPFEIKAQISETLCKGCGLCAAACRGKAIALRGYNDQQLLAEVRGLLRVA
jgi:heterodisulfide reductase subunit A